MKTSPSHAWKAAVSAAVGPSTANHRGDMHDAGKDGREFFDRVAVFLVPLTLVAIAVLVTLAGPAGAVP